MPSDGINVHPHIPFGVINVDPFMQTISACGFRTCLDSKPGTSKHVRVLRDAGLVRVRQDAQRRWYELEPGPLTDIDEWLRPYRKWRRPRKQVAGWPRRWLTR